MNRYDETQYEMKLGIKGEEFFQRHAQTLFFNDENSPYQHGQLHDMRERHRAGDFRMPNGDVVEVKADARCFRERQPTQNVVFEIGSKSDGMTYWQDGWYQDCIKCSVNYLVYLFYRSVSSDTPYAALRIPMHVIVEKIQPLLMNTAYLNAHTRTCSEIADNGKKLSKKLLLIPYREIREEWNGVQEFIGLSEVDS